MRPQFKFTFILTLLLTPALVFADPPAGRGWRANKHSDWHAQDCERDNHLQAFQDPYRFYDHFDYRSDFHPRPAPEPSSFREHADRAIWQGVRSGQLSVREEQELRNMESHILHDQHEASEDGFANWHERKDIQEDQRDFERALQHELYDGEKRYYW